MSRSRGQAFGNESCKAFAIRFNSIKRSQSCLDSLEILFFHLMKSVKICVFWFK